MVTRRPRPTLRRAKTQTTSQLLHRRLQRPPLHRPLLPQRLHPLPNLLLPSPRRQLRLLLRRQLRQVARR